MERAEPDFAPGLAHATPLGILVVDDSARVGDLMRAILTRVEHAVDVVDSPDQALAHLDFKHYDLVISELFLCQQINGLDLARAVHYRWPDVGFILSTGSMAPVSANEPMDAVLLKPFGAAVLREMVTRVAATHVAR